MSTSKKDPIRDDAIYNIIRTQGRNVSIFKRHLRGVDTRKELKHWKNLARNSGGKVYFSAQLVPAEMLAKKEQTIAQLVQPIADAA